VDLEAEGEGPRWFRQELAHAGQVLVPDCPAGRLLTVRVWASGHRMLQRSGIDPRAGEVELRLQRDDSPRARIIGRLVWPDGPPAGKVSVALGCGKPHHYVAATVNEGDGSFAADVQAGDWWLQIDSRGYAMCSIPTRRLEPGSIWDVGAVEMVRGGTLVLRGADLARCQCTVFGGEDRYVASVDTHGEPPTSPLLKPGDYRLLVSGDGSAAQVLPFTIRGDQVTELAVRALPGVRQVIEFAEGAGPAQVPDWLGFEVRREGRLIARGDAHRQGQAPLRCELWLIGGTYTFTTLGRDPQASATFTVGSTEGPPVRIELR
jgi:hypothetical protein